MISDKYIEVDGVPVAVEDTLDWARWFEKANRRVAFTKTNNGDVSTVFLGLNHAWGGGPPLIYETMVFGGDQNEEIDRYSTREQALAGH